MLIRRPLLIVASAVQMAGVSATSVVAHSAVSGETIRISRAAGSITVDGDLGDE